MSSSANKKTSKILVVDDQEDNRDLVEAVLEDNDYTIIMAKDGDEGIAVAQKEDPDLILLDVQMPGIDGFEVCERLKADPATEHIPIIFVTALGSSEANVVKGLKAGAYDFISKPFNGGELLARVSVMLKIRQREEVAKEESNTDVLTSIYNRRFMERRLSEELTRCVGDNQRLVCLFIDIDHFKSINDTFGHPFGDYVIKEVARLLCETVRGCDTVARWGGEEFLALLPGTETKDGIAVAERIRLAIEKQTFSFEGKKAKVTVSTGLYGSRPKTTGETSEEIIRKADEALYKAKHEGRNLVVASEAKH